MTDLRKAAEMALDALRLYVTMYPQMDKCYMVEARETLRQALAQGEQEPVAKREWVGLTDDDMESLVTQSRKVPVEIPCDSFTTRLLKLAEQTLKDKNTT